MKLKSVLVTIMILFNMTTYASLTTNPIDNNDNNDNPRMNLYQNALLRTTRSVPLLDESLRFGGSSKTPSLDNTNSVMEELFTLAREGQQVLGYEKARHVLMGHVYLQQTDSSYLIKDVYCQKEFTNQDFERGAGLGPNRVPDNKVLNVEHTWPQSRFTGKFAKEMQKSDLHHLFPSDSEMNSLRANYKFAEVDNSKRAVKCPISNFGQINGGFRFEPPNVHKGHVARALFYFSVRYKTPIDADEEAYLRKWNAEMPVDTEERLHHEQIAQIQGNRNPFIDHPELVNQISDF
jgi:hypothetical protein